MSLWWRDPETHRKDRCLCLPISVKLATSVVARPNQVTPQLCSPQRSRSSKSSSSTARTRHCILGDDCVIMGLSKKRKQQLSQMPVRAAESHKHRKIDREKERKRRFLRKQREEDFWDGYKKPQSKSSLDESTFEDPSLDEPSSEEDNLEMDNKLGDNTHEGLGDHGGEGTIRV